MMVKSGLEFFFFNSIMGETTFPYFIKVPEITNSLKKKKNSRMEEFQNIFFQSTFHFRPEMVFLDTDSILRVKPMYESVK